MNEMSSTAFRKQYAKLVEPTVVTVNGHPIGTWTPALVSWRVEATPAATPHNREGGRFGRSQPAPKPGQRGSR